LRHRFIGIDTLALDSGYAAAVFDVLRPRFESGTLQPFPVLAANVYPFARASEAYRAVLAGAPERVVLDPTKIGDSNIATAWGERVGARRACREEVICERLRFEGLEVR